MTAGRPPAPSSQPPTAYDRAGVATTRDWAGDFDKAAKGLGLVRAARSTRASSSGLRSPSSSPPAPGWRAGAYRNGAIVMEQAAKMKWAAGFARQSTFDAWNKAALAWISPASPTLQPPTG